MRWRAQVHYGWMMTWRALCICPCVAAAHAQNESQGIAYGRGDFEGFGGEVGGQYGGEVRGHGQLGDVGDGTMGGQLFGEFRVDERMYPPNEYDMDQSVSRDVSQSVTHEGQQFATPPGQYPPSPEQLQQLHQQQHQP